MKKSLLLGITGITLVTLTATTLYAQATTGTSIVDKMKAAVHAFTLSASLNPGQTGLDSAPIKGKKTGDILTAGEYNRILELISEGGSGGSGWADVPLTDTADFDTECLYQVKLKVTDATNINLMNGDTSWRVGTIKGSKYLGLAFTDGTGASYAVWGIPSSNKQSFGYRDATGTFAPQNSVSVLGLKKLCGGGGSSTGGGVEIVSGGIIETGTVTEHTLSGNWDLITLEGAWKSTDAAPSGGYIYKLGGQKKMSISIATGVSKDTVLTNDYQCAQDFCVKLSGENVIIKPGISTVAYLMWKFTGGSGASSTPSCYEKNDISLASTYTAGGIALDHNLGSRPVQIEWFVENMVADGGYQPGDRVYAMDFQATSGGEYRSIAFWNNQQQVGMTWDNAGATYKIQFQTKRALGGLRTTPTQFTADSPKWSLGVRACK